MSSENRNLEQKLQALLDAKEELRDFSSSHPGEFTSATKEVKGSEIILEASGPPEWYRLVEIYQCAKTEYDNSIRKDERERIIKAIDSERV